MREFKLPDLGEGIEGGDVVQVLVREGDVITAEQTIVEIETDKAVLEVPCPFGGKVAKVHVKQGERVGVGAVLVSVDEAGAGDAGGAPAEPEPSAAKPQVAEKPRAKEAEPVPASQVSGAPAREEGVSESPQEVPASRPAPAEEAERAPRPPAEGEPIPAGPGARRLARELGVDLAAVAAAHPGRRVTEQVIKDFVKQRQAPVAAGTTSAAGGTGVSPGAGVGVVVPPLPDFAQWGPIERVPVSSLQRKAADRLRAAWLMAPHVTQFDEADITALERLRKRYRETEKGKDVRLTVTAFVLKAAAQALRLFGQFNASLDADAGELILKKYVHIGMAVDTEAGLIVPVIRDVDKKPVLQIAAEMNELAERTRQRKIAVDELRGGTFTVTNLGGIGGTAFTPIINYPEVAILGLARTREAPVVEDGRLSTRLMLPLCLSYDHRVINGADGARFVRKLASVLEDPELLLLEG